MNLIKAQAALAKCESELRTLLAEAASSGDYDGVLKLTSWARAVAGLAGTASMPATKTVTPSVVGRTRKKGGAGSYPRFVRRGDGLVKIGWSKREKTIYEHKTTLSAVEGVASIVKKKGADGRIFQISALLPCHEADGETIVPDYQVYLIVAWWRSVGLLEQHGRQGYSIPKPSDFTSAVEHACNDLSGS
jgi:hypothetical protein